ncbi:hypothetical protein K1T71_000613 [Dendrolimus kikuchii]|uniref:Uncharacterized protein n=1 Tax=Dendrolimus kikuchii TaxID=765133 RepID=A0ACC1DJX6_9NEOP|nr:hypothetical protein K1T71_000613 [Dendrolimus kikuchii]
MNNNSCKSYSNTDEMSQINNPLNDLNLLNIVNHYKLNSTPSTNNITQNELVEKNINQNISNGQIKIDKAQTEHNEMEAKISSIKELNETSMNYSKMLENTTDNSFQNLGMFHKINDCKEYSQKEGINFALKCNSHDLKSFTYDTTAIGLQSCETCDMENNTYKQSVRDVNGQSKSLDIAMGPQIIKPKLKKSVHTEDAISINGMNKAQVDEFNEFFDKYENLSHNESSDSGISQDLMFECDNLKTIQHQLEKLFLHENEHYSNNNVMDVFDIITKKEEIKISDRDFVIETDINENFSSMTDCTRTCSIQDQNMFTVAPSEKTDSMEYPIDIFVKNVDLNSTYIENPVLDCEPKFLVNIAIDLSTVNDFPKVLIPKLNKNNSIYTKKTQEVSDGNTEVIDDGRYIDIKATCSLKEQFSKITDAKPFKGPFVILVNSDGEETIISTNDDETIKTLNENIDDDTVEIETDKIIDTEYFSDETEIKNSVKEKLENATKFSNMDPCFENQLRKSLLRDMPQTIRQKICSCSSNIDRTTNTFQNDFEVTDNFLRSKKIDSEVEAKDIDKSTFETPNFEKIIQACTDTVLNVLQNQIPLPNKEELNKNVPHHNQVSTYDLKQSEQALNIQGITNKLLKDIDMQDTAIVKNLKINEKIPTQMLRTDLGVLDRENCATNSYQTRRNCNIPTVEKNKKLYAKRSVKSDAEKHNFTKGPTLYEKSIVLPQILERLAVRKAKFDEENKFVRRLILDDPSEIFNNAANITNNKANITDASPNIKKPNTPNTFVNTINNDKEVNIKHNTKTTNNFKVTNAVIDNIRLPKENILSKYMPVTKSNKPGDCAGNSSTNNVTNSNVVKVNTSAGLEGVSKSTENNTERVELNPEILLEDCNKERLLEWKRRQWFRKFVE